MVSDAEKEKIKSRAMADLKKEHPDWDDKKLKMQTGRRASSDIAKAELEERKNGIRDAVQKDNPYLDGDKLEKEIEKRIKEEDNKVLIEKKQNEKTELLEKADVLTVEIAKLREGKKPKTDAGIPRAKVEALLKN